jgi:Immunoglobulin I-set domain
MTIYISKVSWFHDTMQIDQTERHVMESRGARHTLLIRRITSQDLGNYSCTADNQLGKTRKTITLTGRPKSAVFRSAPISQWKDKYNVSWSVESFAPIEEYKLYFRVISHRASDSHLMDANFFQQKNKPLFGNGDPGDTYHQPPDFGAFDPFHTGQQGDTGGFGNHLAWNNDEWRELVIQPQLYTQRYTQGANYMLRGLEPDQQYEAKIISR